MEQMAEYMAQQQARYVILLLLFFDLSQMYFIRNMFCSKFSSGNGLMKSTEATLDPSTLGFKLTAASAPIEEVDKKGRKAGESAQPSTAVRSVYLFEVMPDKVGRVKECALTDLKRPLVSEYDFRRDHKNPSLDIALRPTTKIRYYQVICNKDGSQTAFFHLYRNGP